MSSYKFNIVIEQKATFVQDFDFLDLNNLPIDTTGMTGTCLLRKAWTSANSIALGVTLNTGKITLTMDANTSSNVTPGFYVYTVNIKDSNNNVYRTQEGVCTVTPST